MSGIKPALEDTGFIPVRVDQLQHNAKIDDRILAELRECGLVISDVTQHKHGVYCEAGLALGRGVPVIWCCREDEVAKSHFDTRQHNHVTWRTTDELRQRLTIRIRATLGGRRPKEASAADP